MQEVIKYQQIDAQIRKLESQLDASKNKKGAEEMRDYVKMCQVKILKLEEKAKSLSDKYTKAVSLYNEFVQKLEKLEQGIEAVTDDKLQGLQATVQSFISNAEVLENNIDMLSKGMDTANKEYESLMANAQKARKNHDLYKSAFSSEKAKFEPEIQKLRNELSKQGEKVAPDLLAKYKAKSESKLFPIFVPETKGRCGGCRMEIPAGKMADLSKKGFVECENENCGRIIYKA